MKHKIRVQDVMRMRPCEDYPRDRIKALIGDGMTAREIAAIDVPEEDRLWVLLRWPDLSDRAKRLLACKWAAIAVEVCWQPFSPDDNRPQQCVETARRFANGQATEKELEAACAAARAAACAAERAAAEAAARAAAEAAARAAAWAAAEAAARAAACAAARAAACAAERAAAEAAWATARATAWADQIADLVEAIEATAPERIER